MIDRTFRVLTWHIHGSYLYYLTQVPCTFFIPVREPPHNGYGGRTPNFPWGDNVIEVPAAEVRNIDFDCVLFQSKDNYLIDQYELLSQEQRRLPRIFLEHDPPRNSPVDTTHVVDDPDILLVHVTHFNHLMWNNNRTPSTVITHGIVDPGYLYRGNIEKGVVVINNISTRGRRLGLDVFLRVKEVIPLDIVGMGSEEVGGLGEISLSTLPRFISQYRFLFNPIRYTSLGLAVCEAMMAGLPVVGFATTEMPMAVTSGVSGFLSTDEDALVARMRELLHSPSEAQELSKGSRQQALEKFSIHRFVNDWCRVLESVCRKPAVQTTQSTGEAFEKNKGLMDETNGND